MNASVLPEPGRPADTHELSQLVPVPDYRAEDAERRFATREQYGRWCCEQLECGNILFFPSAPFGLSEEQRAFLLAQRQSGASYHKNVAYRPAEDRLTGYAKGSPENEEKLRAIVRAYSQWAAGFLAETLSPYAQGARLDYASFRPIEERGRPSRLRARNDLLHTDAFPTRPTNGDRILRLFTNLNPQQPRVWVTSETFEALTRRYARDAGLPEPKRGSPGGFFRFLARFADLSNAQRSPYDAFMLRFHNYLKENHKFQESCPKNRWEFPPNSTWIVYTDMVSHAVLSGRFALEQTFMISRKVMVLPEKAPVSVLENLCGFRVTRE